MKREKQLKKEKRGRNEMPYSTMSSNNDPRIVL